MWEAMRATLTRRENVEGERRPWGEWRVGCVVEQRGKETTTQPFLFPFIHFSPWFLPISPGTNNVTPTYLNLFFRTIDQYGCYISRNTLIITSSPLRGP